VTITLLGEDCLQIYTDRLQELYAKKPDLPEGQQFDAVILDYKMPDRNGLEVAKEILTINPHQRIILASAYLEQTLIDAIKELSGCRLKYWKNLYRTKGWSTPLKTQRLTTS